MGEFQDPVSRGPAVVALLALHGAGGDGALATQQLLQTVDRLDEADPAHAVHVEAISLLDELAVIVGYPTSSKLARFIDRAAAAAWLAGSALPEPVWHSTHPSYRDSFLTEGIRIDLGHPETTCAGFYCNTQKPWVRPLGRPDPKAFNFEVAIRALNPIHCNDPAGIASLFDGQLRGAQARDNLLARGHDAIVCANGVVVGLDETKMRLVTPFPVGE